MSRAISVRCVHRVSRNPGAWAELNLRGASQAFTNHMRISMGSTQRKKSSTTRSKSGRTKRKPASSRSTTKALVNKADHVRRQALKPGPSIRAPGKDVDTNERLSHNGPGKTPEVLRTAANENLRPVFSGPTRVLAFWSPMAVLLWQQTLFASIALNVIQSQRLWAQAWSVRRDSA